ncbi:MAG TPA: DUF4167 domain-containing protein [Caulobacteraceae bacterium]
MRDFKGMKRQRGRNRGGGGGGKPQHNANRAFESNGPEGVKVRGAAQTVFERYQQLARDASSSGDRVLAENYLQHAEHYFRTLRAMQPNKPAAEIYGRDQFASGFDIDFEAEPSEDQAEASSEGEDGGEGEGQQQQGQQRDRYENRDRNRDDRQRDGARDNNQQNRQRDDRQQGDRPQRDDRQQQGEGRQRYDRRDRWRDRDDRQQQGEQAVSETPAAEPTPSGPVLRSEDGEVSHAPAFLGRAAPEPRADGDEPAPKAPRRRRAPRTEASTEEA